MRKYLTIEAHTSRATLALVPSTSNTVRSLGCSMPPPKHDCERARWTRYVAFGQINSDRVGEGGEDLGEWWRRRAIDLFSGWMLA